MCFFHTFVLSLYFCVILLVVLLCVIALGGWNDFYGWNGNAMTKREWQTQSEWQTQTTITNKHHHTSITKAISFSRQANTFDV